MVPCSCSASFGFIPCSISLFLCHVLTPLRLNSSLPLQQGQDPTDTNTIPTWKLLHDLQVLPAFKCIPLPHICFTHYFYNLLLCGFSVGFLFGWLGFHLAFILSLHHGNLSLLVDRHQVFLLHSSRNQTISLLHLSCTSLWAWVKANFHHINWYGAVFSHHANLLQLTI